MPYESTALGETIVNFGFNHIWDSTQTFQNEAETFLGLFQELHPVPFSKTYSIRSLRKNMRALINWRLRPIGIQSRPVGGY